MNDADDQNYQVFRDCIAAPLIQKSSEGPTKKSKKSKSNGRRKTAIKPLATEENHHAHAAEELADFIDYIALEIFSEVPATLRSLTYTTWLNTPSLQAQYPDPLPTDMAESILLPLSPSIADSLTTYNFIGDKSLVEFLMPVLGSYLSTVIAAPPPPSMTKDSATECEICDRSWIPLTYHHLIPRGVHAKVLKRGWHTEDKLNDVAWICRACHSFVHRMATNEELARDYYTVELLMGRQELVDFAKWVGKVRWKTR